MAHIIEIDDSDSKDEFLIVELPMLLDEINFDGEELHWSILYLYATGNLGIADHNYEWFWSSCSGARC